MTAPPETTRPPPPAAEAGRRRRSFAGDFQRFFLRGLGTLLPTIITVAVIWYVVNFLWDSIGWYLVEAIKNVWLLLIRQGLVDPANAMYVNWFWATEKWYTKPLGVLLALVLIYLVGLLVGNFIGRFFYRTAEKLVLRVPVVRALYPAIKQVTDLLVGNRDAGQFQGSRVVAVRPHADDIWSLALVTGPGLVPLSRATGQEMVTVFMPSSPTAFSGYVILVPRKNVVELPMTVEEAMRLLVSGGVLMPKPAGPEPADPTPMPADAKRAVAARPQPPPPGVVPQPL